jgi:hypothetical protein
MCEEMANRYFFQTDISPQWLLAADRKAPPISSSGEPYTLQVFERSQATMKYRETPPKEVILADALHYVARLIAILSSAQRNGKSVLADYKVGKAMDNLAEEFGQEARVYPADNRRPDLVNADQVLNFLKRETVKIVKAWRETNARSKSQPQSPAAPSQRFGKPVAATEPPAKGKGKRKT